jgi:hypothetical protein
MADNASRIEILQDHLASEQLHLPVFPPITLQLQDMLSQEMSVSIRLPPKLPKTWP